MLLALFWQFPGLFPSTFVLRHPCDGAEHIGSKTAVQIRSHAQKFFSKLEKQEMSGAKVEGAREDALAKYLVHKYPECLCVPATFSTFPTYAGNFMLDTIVWFVARSMCLQSGKRCAESELFTYLLYSPATFSHRLGGGPQWGSVSTEASYVSIGVAFCCQGPRLSFVSLLLTGLPKSISIPPPRPKRKPSHPYPRKPFSGVGSYDGPATAEGAGSQDQLPAQAQIPDYSHLAPKLSGNERMDVAVAAVAQAASAAAAAAAAAVISAAGEQIRAHMQVGRGIVPVG